MSTKANTSKSPSPRSDQLQNGSGFWTRLRRYGFQSTPLYQALLWGRAPRDVRFSVPEIWPGDPHTGARLLAGDFCFCDECHKLNPDGTPPTQATREWQAWYHGHTWLKDVRALGTGEATNFTRERLSAWLDTQRDWAEIPWRTDVAAQRLIQWCQNWSFILENDADPLVKALRRIAGRDARHIMRSLPAKTTGFQRFHTIKGQIYAVFALLGDARERRTLERLEREIAEQVLPDGGHIERSPERLAEVLQDLLELRALLQAATGEVPGFVQNAIDRAAPMLRTLRHPDGGLAVFNGGLESDPVWLDQLLAHTETKAKAPQSAPHTGFQRLYAGDVSLIMDCHVPTNIGYLQHGGTLGFELSLGKQRLFVNCGARKGIQDPWRTALAATAAHTCLSVNDSSSATFHLDGRLKRGPRATTCERQDIDQGAFVETSHDGYMDEFGLTHHRAIYVASHGTDIRGEERLVGTGGEYYTLRFHLHPDIKASVLGDGKGVMLRLPNKNVWRLRTSATDIHLDSSIYMGTFGPGRHTEQIVISGSLSGNGALIKWALTREDS